MSPKIESRWRAEIAELEAAGCYDAAAPDAPQQREYFEYLFDLAFALPEIVQACADGTLAALAGTRVLRPGQRLTASQLAAACGLDEPAVLRIWRAWGFPNPEAGEHRFTHSDVETMTFLKALAELIGLELVVQTSRTIGTAVAQIAEAEVALLRSRLEAPLVAGGASSATIARTFDELAEGLLPGVTQAIDTLHRHHVETVAQRYGEWNVAPSETNAVEFVVGFADMANYTTLARTLDLAQLAELLAVFEERTSDLVAAAGARLAKRIGDAVMFITPAPDAACALALDLVACSGADPPLPSLRVGMAFGAVAARQGDFYGSAVNLAARITSAANPGQALVSSELRDQMKDAGETYQFAALPPRALDGFETPQTLYVLERRRR